MKTRLLLLLLLAFSAGNAQFSINESFESGFPSGWTVDGLGTTPTAFGACTGTNSMAALLNASNPFAVIYTDSYTSNGNAVAISFNRRANTASVTGTAFLYYQIGAAAWQLITSNGTIPGSCTQLSFNIPAGTIPAGSSVKFRMQMNSTSGDTVYFDDFSAVQSGAPAPVLSNLSAQITSSTSADLSFFIQNSCVNIYYAIQFSTSVGFSSPFYSPTTLMTDCSATAIQKTVSRLGLTPNTTYYYRILASENSNVFVNTVISSTASFSTGIVVPTFDHQNITATTADIVFSIQNNCTSTDYTIQYSTSPSFTGPLYSTLTNMTECSTTALDKTVQLTGLTTGVTYYYRVLAKYNASGSWEVITATKNFVGGQINIISVAHQNVQYNSADIEFTVQNNCSIVYYRVEYSKFSNFSNSLFTATESSSSCSGNLTTQVQNLTSLNGNTVYYYRLQVSYNAVGPWTNSATQNFTTAVDPSGLIQEWKFDTTRTNESNDLSFPNNGGSAFVVDRFGDANKALYLSNIGTNVIVPNLPLNSAPRTVSIWVQMVSYQTNPLYSYVFGYGSITTSASYGFAYQISAGFVIGNNYGYGDDLQGLFLTSPGTTWHHIVTTYDGVTAKFYFDGVLKTSMAKSWITSGMFANYFRLGQATNGTSTFQGAVDDLKIYNRALSDSEVTSLFTTNTLSSTNFAQNNLEVVLYPNPVSDILNIETALDLKSVEVYNIQGQKVMSSNQKQINVADLAAGMYMIRIEDADNAIATKKFVKR